MPNRVSSPLKLLVVVPLAVLVNCTGAVIVASVIVANRDLRAVAVGLVYEAAVLGVPILLVGGRARRTGWNVWDSVLWTAMISFVVHVPLIPFGILILGGV